MKSYDKIILKNNFDTEEFVITILRDETIEGIIEGVNHRNELVNSENDPVNIENDRANPQNDTEKSKNEGVNFNFEGVKQENEGVKLKIEGVKGKLNQELEIIYDFIKENPLVKTAAIEQFNYKSNATIERYLKILKDNGLIEYIGSDKTGGYKVTK